MLKIDYLRANDFMKRLYLLLFMWSMLFSNPLAAQNSATLSKDATIFLLTIYPGDELYSTFGHTAIRIIDDTLGLDRIYNYGTFDFEEPGFYIKFCRGKLDYFLSAYRYKWAESVYTLEKRPIISQRLNLTPEMKNRIFQFLEWNRQPENRGYRYDFFFDNCATRILDAFEKTFPAEVNWHLKDRQLTFRNYIDQYLTGHPFSDYGIDLALGAKTDRIASPRETAFLPDYLYDAFASAQVNINGEIQPLVAETDTLLWFDEANERSYSFPWANIILWAVFLLAILITFREFKSNKNAEKRSWLDIFLFGYAGFVGMLIMFLWFGTDHTTTPNNWNLLWAWPLHIVISVLLLFRKKPAWLTAYLAICTGVLMITLLGWAFWPQRLHTATIAMVLTLAVRGGWFVYKVRFHKKPHQLPAK